MCDYYNVKISDLLSTRRMQVIAKLRQVAMYLCKMLTSKSLPEIGPRFAGCDHTTVMHSKRIKEACANNREFSNDVEVLRWSLVL